MASPRPVPPVVRVAGRIRPPEPGEHEGRLPRAQAHPVVPDGDRHGRVVGAQSHLDGSAVTVLDRICDEVAQHALDPARVHLGHTGEARLVDDELDALARSQRAVGVDRPLDAATQVVASISSTAAPASNREISSRSVRRDSKRSSSPMSSSADLATVGSNVTPRVVDEVRGHPDRCQGGSQLVRDVGDEALLDPGQVLELGNLLLQRRRHGVERVAEARQVVLSLGSHALVEVSLRETLGDDRSSAHRIGDEPGDDEGDGAHEEDERDPTEHEGPTDEVDDVPLALHGIDEVQAVVADHRQGHLLADDERGDGAVAESTVVICICCRSGFSATARDSSFGMKRAPTEPLSIGPMMFGLLFVSRRDRTT